MSARTKLIGAIAGIVIGMAIPLLYPFDDLSFQAACALGILAGAIIWWICNVLPDYLTALIMAVLMMLFANIVPTTMFSSFASSTWWMLLAAFGLGIGMQQTGLMKRIAMAILGLFPKRYEGQILGLMAAGTIAGPLVPSLSVKAAIMAPLSMDVAQSQGYEKQSREIHGLFLAMFTGIRTIAPAVINASVIGYALLALFPDSIKEQFTMGYWFLCALPWFVVVFILNYVTITLLYRPKKKFRKKVNVIPDEKTPLSKPQKQMLAIMLVTIALWVTEPVHAIPAFIISILSLSVVLASRIYDHSVFLTKMKWDTLIFIGILLGLAPVFSQLGIDQWLIGLFEPYLATIVTNPYLFVVGLGALTVLLRFVIVSEIAYINLVMVFLIPLAVACGINPWVAGFVVYCLVNPWFMPYQNPIYITAYSSVAPGSIKHSAMAKYCLIYCATCIAGLLVSVPVWQHLGLFG